MAEKRKLHHILRDLHKLALWQLLLILSLMFLISATFLRLNNIGMMQRRDAVIVADKNGDATTITNRLVDLQNYVSSHMNTGLGNGVELTESYKRDQAAIVAANQPEANVNIYKAASEHCKSTGVKVLAVFRQCVFDYLDSIPGGTVVASTMTGEQKFQSLYIYNFISPLWSPDFAGVSVLISTLLFAIIVLRLIAIAVLHLMLKRQYKSI